MRIVGRRVLVIAIILFSLSSLANIPKESRAYTSHDPIYINGDWDFTSANGVTGGSGTPSDPYIIEGWEIAPSARPAIQILNTASHFVIRGVHVHSEGHDYDGMWLINIANGSVENTMIQGTKNGLLLDSSTNVTLTTNSISGNGWDGILVESSTNVAVVDNDVSLNVVAGIRVTFSTDVTITDNNISLNSDQGVSLYASTNITLEGNHISHNYWGVHLGFSTDATITNNSPWR